MQVDHRSQVSNQALLSVAAAVMLAAAAAGQVSLADFSGDTSNAQLGSALTAIGDVNADGVMDIAVASNQWGGTTYGPYRGRVSIFDGATGVLLRPPHDGAAYSDCGCSVWCGCTAGEVLGVSLDGIGDVNVSGIDDYAVGAPYADTSGNNGTGRVIVYEGSTGAVIRTHYGLVGGDAMGWSLCAAGDLDLVPDGIPDYVIGAPNHDPSGLTNAGAVYAFSGDDGLQLWVTYGYRGAGGSIPNGDQFGYAVDAIADITADGKSEILVGAPNGTAPPTGVVTTINCGAWYVLDGATGAVLFHKYGGATGDRLGERVSGLGGDIDGDFVPDFVVQRNKSGAERVHLYSGVGGFGLGTMLAPVASTGFGNGLSGFGDGDGDGVLDFAVGAPTFDGAAGVDSGKLYVYSYVGGSIVQVSCVEGLHAADRLGASVDGLAPGIVEHHDWNGDTFHDLLVGAPHDSSNFGLASVYPAFCLPGETYCVTTPNSVGPGALIGYTGSNTAGSTNFTLTATGLPPNKVGIFFYGDQSIQQTVCGATRCVGGSFFRLPIVTSNQSGVASYLVTTSPPITAHETWRFQFWYRDPQGPTPCGTNYSDALKIAFCP